MANRNYPGAYAPTTNIWDVTELQTIQDPAMRELLIRLYQNLNRMALVTNVKDSALYPLDEFVTGGQFFANQAQSSATAANPILRNTFRMVVNFGALPNNATKSVPHNINIGTNANITFTRIYGTASDVTNFVYIPLPQASNFANETVRLYVDATNVNVQTIGNFSTYTVCYIVLEYLKT